MVASTLGVADEDSVFAVLEVDGDELPDPLSGAHLALREEFEASQQPLHPWARAMYREGFSFNGNERSHLWLSSGDQGLVDLSDTAGADSPLDGRAAIGADFDGDGDLDLFVHNLQRSRHQVFRNELSNAESRSLGVRLRATSGQWEAIGAEVTVAHGDTRTSQVLARGAGFASCGPSELLFGLGGAPDGRVLVRWPGGAVEDFGALAPGRYRLCEGTAKAQEEPCVRGPMPDPWPPGMKLGAGDEVPRLDLLDPEGQAVSLDPRQADGRRLLIAFWASYCSPCRAELSALEDLAQAGGHRVVVVSVDVPRDRDRARELVRAGAPSVELTFLPADADPEDDAAPGLDAVIDLMRLPVPTSLEVGADGRVLALHRRLESLSALAR
ncbi:MAG: ASPIC/UnbV domain-containing protein [Planctomycetota bacterium]|nr:ASPIC/UnbV domain-containing protein [Planctomycetota bacterium]